MSAGSPIASSISAFSLAQSLKDVPVFAPGKTNSLSPTRGTDSRIRRASSLSGIQCPAPVLVRDDGSRISASVGSSKLWN
jgi:hypothetical protein